MQVLAQNGGMRWAWGFLAAASLWAQGALEADPTEAAPPLRLEVLPPDFLFQFRPRAKVPGQRSLALALGGGAAKGIAHAGVLQRLDEEGLVPDSIAGTSMGAFMGAMYAVGHSGLTMQELMQRVDLGSLLLDRQRRSLGETLWEQEARTSTVFSMEFNRGQGFSFEPGSSSGLEVKRTLQWLLSRGLYYAGPDLDRLRMPFRAVSTNLQTSAADAPRRASLVDAVRASMCIPGMFRPVLLDGDQHVDGILVENLPVYQARQLSPDAIVLAVEVGGQMEAVRSSTVFSVLLRTLDIAIEERTRFSRDSADIHLRPDTRQVEYLEFNKQVQGTVDLGRASFDQQAADLERRLYGPDGDLPLPAGAPVLDAPPDLQPALRSLAVQSYPASGSPVRRDALRWLRRIHAAGLADQAELSFPRFGSPLLKITPHPLLRAIQVDAPPDWRDFIESLLEAEGLKPGHRFNPASLGRSLERFLLEATLLYRPTMNLEGTGFDPATGLLRVKVHEPRVESVRIAGDALRGADSGYLQGLMADMIGAPLDARRLFDHMAMAESRLNLEELELGGEAGQNGPILLLTPNPRRRVTFDVSLAYESTWGMHAGVDSHFQNFLGSGSAIDLQASTNRLQDSIEVDFSRAFRSAPRSGWRVFARHFEERFLPEGLEEPALLTPYSEFLSGRTLRSRDLGFGLHDRFGRGDRGLWRLDLSRRWSDFLPQGAEFTQIPSDQAQLSAEWDSFDRYTFPTGGGMFRLLAGQGRVRSPQASELFRWGYLRGQSLHPMGSWVSLHLDGEAGLGWNLPLNRWYSVGGPSFLVGSRSAGFLTPNFALARLGVSFRLANTFGLNTWLEPRVDAGYLGGFNPTDLREGTRVRGLGLNLRTEVGRFYVELAAGRTWLAGEGKEFIGRGTTLNLLVGTRPWDVWKRR
jgi:predicted acylesterase/phospholipase RssA